MGKNAIPFRDRGAEIATDPSVKFPSNCASEWSRAASRGEAKRDNPLECPKGASPQQWLKRLEGALQRGLGQLRRAEKLGDQEEMKFQRFKRDQKQALIDNIKAQLAKGETP